VGRSLCVGICESFHSRTKNDIWLTTLFRRLYAISFSLVASDKVTHASLDAISRETASCYATCHFIDKRRDSTNASFLSRGLVDLPFFLRHRHSSTFPNLFAYDCAVPLSVPCSMARGEQSEQSGSSALFRSPNFSSL